MDFTTHQFAKGVVDKSVADQGRFSGKFCRDDEQAVVTAAASGPIMPGVFRRIVNQFKAKRIEFREPFAQNRFEIAESFARLRLVHAGKAFLNGLTVTLA